MSSYDANGRLKITLTGATGSTSASTGSSGVSVYHSGALVLSNATSINFTELSGTGLIYSASISGSSGVSVSVKPMPVMAITGFHNTNTHGYGSYYFAPNYSSLPGGGSGTGVHMIAALWKRKHYDSDLNTLAGHYDWNSGVGWYIYSVQTSVGGTNLIGEGNVDVSFPAYSNDKWILQISTYDGISFTFSTFLNGQLHANGAAGDPGIVSTTPFIIGALGNSGATSGSRSGTPAVEIAAVAFCSSSINENLEDHIAYYNKCVAAGDIVQDSTMNWDNLWSVKQNAPGATWAPAVGSITLLRTGSLAIVTDSNPKWF